MKILKLFLFVMSFNFMHLAQADVWTVTQSWSPEFETKYQEWLVKNAKVDMFSKEFLDDKVTPNPYFGITTDCADTVYSLRILFSYENGLPWAMKQPWDTKRLLTQSMKRFDQYPEGPERLKAFLKYIYDIVGSSSISNDTYPISINDIRPGTVIVTSHKNHHSWTIVEIKRDGNPRLIYNSTVGKESGSKLQQRISWPNPYWIFEPEEVKEDPNDPNSPVNKISVYHPGSYAGLRYWIPVDKLKSEITTIEGYSEDQFALDLSFWKMTIQRKLAKTKESIQDIVLRLLTDACSDVKQRMDAVVEAENFKMALASAFDAEKNPDIPLSTDFMNLLMEFRSSKQVPQNNMCLTPEKYDQYSTPSRDRRMFDSFMLARTYFKYGLKKLGEKGFVPDRLGQLKKIFTQPLKSALKERESEKNQKPRDRFSICSQYFGQSLVDLAEVKRRLFNNMLSSNPNEDLTGRWGGRASPMPLAAQCSTYGETYPPFDLEAAEAQAQLEVDAYDQISKEKNIK